MINTPNRINATRLVPTRNPAIELYRILLMLGICVLHADTLGGPVTIWFANALMPCVTCFVFLSGYFGIKFSWSRVVKILVLAIACIPATAVVGIVFCDYSITAALTTAAIGVRDNWFLWAYIILMMFSPILNLACECADRLLYAVPIMVVACMLAFFGESPFFRSFLPHPAGVGSYTFLMMIGVYLLARLFRIYNIASHFRFCFLPVATLLLVALASIGFGRYSSPISVCIACVTFPLFESVHINEGAGKIIRFIAKSTFPIFILHANGIGFHIMKSMNASFCDHCLMPNLLVYLVTGLSFFCGGLLLDMPRRIISCFVEPFVRPVLQRVDASYHRLCAGGRAE